MKKLLFGVFLVMFALAATARANHEDHIGVVNLYALKASEASSVRGGLFLGLLWGLVGFEYDELGDGDGAVFFRGLSSQIVVFPMGESGGIAVFPVRPVLSFGNLDGSFGGRVGFDLVYQPNHYEIYNLFGGISHWMNVRGMRITAIQVGFGF